MAAHLNIQIVSSRQVASRARHYARATRAVGKRKWVVRRERERFDFMIEIKAPRIEIGSSIEREYKDSWVDPINDLLRKKVLTKVNDALIADVAAIVEKCALTNEYAKEEGQKIVDFLTVHKGQRCYAKWW